MNPKHPHFTEALQVAKTQRPLYYMRDRSPQKLHKDLKDYRYKTGEPISASTIGDIVNYCFYPHENCATLRNIMEGGF